MGRRVEAHDGLREDGPLRRRGEDGRVVPHGRGGGGPLRRRPLAGVGSGPGPIALGYEGACLPLVDHFADAALAISETPSLGRLNAIMGKAHVVAIRGDRRVALLLLEEGRRVFDSAGSYEQTSDYSVPEWRMAVFCSLLLARLGDERRALEAQETALRTLPASLPRFATHLEMHRALTLSRAGDRPGGVEYARAALDKLPSEKHSLTLRLLLAEVEGRAA